MKFLLLAVGIFLQSQTTFAYVAIQAAQPVAVTARKILVVTHAATDWDGYKTTKPGLDAAIANIKSLHGSTYYLVYGDKNQLENEIVKGTSNFFFADLNPTAYVYGSTQGEHKLKIVAPEIYWAGGYFESCSSASISRTLNDIAANPSKVPVFNYVMDSLFTTCPNLQTTVVTSPDAQFPETYDNTIPLSRCLNEKIPASERLAFLRVYFSDVIPLRIKEMIEVNDPNFVKWYPKLPPVEKFTFDVWYKKQHLGTVGSGPIHLQTHFINSSDIH